MELVTGDILVVGLGVSGEAAAHFLVERAALDDQHVVVVDSSDTPRLREIAQVLGDEGAEVLLGVHEVGGEFGLAVVSPGVPPTAPLRLSAEEHSQEVIGELELAYRISSASWVGVTGTNGKTTVTSLIVHLLSDAGIAAMAAGNIGPAATDIARTAGSSTVIVAELSSFQLSTTRDFHPKVSVLLNITPDHLDWHGSLDAYTADKAAIFNNQGPGDTAIIDIDDPGSAALLGRAQAKGTEVMSVSTHSVPIKGGGLRDGMLVLSTPAGELELVHRDELAIKGDHNVSNALAAAVAAYACGSKVSYIGRGLRSFEPIAHRLEPVGVVCGIEYVNDSKATNPEATLKALTAFSDRPLIVLLGGRNKGNSFEALAQGVARSCKGAVVFGEEASSLADALARAGMAASRAEDLERAVRQAADLAVPGDAILLSPACASFDQFSDYVARGDSFRQIVEQMTGAER